MSEFRAPSCHQFDLTSMGMHPKFCKLRILPSNLKTLPTWSPCLVRGNVFLGVDAALWRLSKPSIVDGSNVYRSSVLVFCRLEQCRQEQGFAARRIGLSTRAFLEAIPAVGAACLGCLGAWEACLGGLGGLSRRPGRPGDDPSGGRVCRQEHSWRPVQQLGRPVWAAWVPGKLV